MNLVLCKTVSRSHVPGCELAPDLFYSRYHQQLKAAGLKPLHLDLTNSSHLAGDGRIKDPSLFLGGDHSTTALIHQYLGIQKKKVLIFDAHNDFSSAQNRDEELYNWNIINFLLEQGCEILVVGLRAYHPGMKKSSRVSYIESTDFVDMDKVAVRIKEFVEEGTYISIDMDVLNPIEFPHVNFQVPGGIFFRELLICLDIVLERNPHCLIDIVEYNPVKNEGLSSELLLTLIKRIAYRGAF